jgi:hypothetical protein
VIYKYEVPVFDKTGFDAPGFERIMHVDRGATVDQLYVWATVDTDLPVRRIGLCVVGTGNPLPDTGPFVGTVLAPPFVWHVFRC